MTETSIETITEAFACTAIGAGEFQVELGERWRLPYGVVFGGAMMAGSLLALDEHTGGRNVLAASSHFLRPGEPGPAVAVVDDVKQGMTASTHRVTLHQGDRPVLTTLATVGPEATGSTRFADAPPALPPRSECSDPRTRDGEYFPDWVHFQDLLAPTDEIVDFFAGEVLEEPDLHAWVRLRDGAPINGARLALLADDWPPSPWMLGTFGIMRTVELNLHLFHSGHRGWAMARVRTRVLFDDLFTVSGALWSEDGEPLGEWRQVALFEPKSELA